MAEKVDFKALFKGELNHDTKFNIKNNTKNDINIDTNVENIPTIAAETATIKSKDQDKSFTITTVKKAEKKQFPVYMTQEKLDKLDQLCKEIGCTRNTLINQMVDYCLHELDTN